ncbi:MAG: ATP-binding protein [Candidatus Poribacteria bacterium]|nr:ATP-binding protein [Candidatus Poribacteria bacterium]
MKITKIEIKNFKVFRGPDVIDLSKKGGQSLLLYGENGSGKTSLYKALELFLESSENDSLRFIDHKNFPAMDDGDDGYVRLHFTPNPNLQKTTYEWSDSEVALNDTKVQPIIDASKAKGFLDYKALLHTHYLHYEEDVVDVFDLLIKTLLKNVINDISVPARSFAEEWQDLSELLFPEQGTVQEVEIPQQQLVDFNTGIENILIRLEADANKMLRKFRYENTVIELYLKYQEPKFNSDIDKYEPPQILLRVDFCGSTRPKHHQFLNEAKLSAIALSIFFAGFQLQPPSALKVLALDDALIGLDMSNRLPLIDILDAYFSDYQIFLMTYDKAFYEIFKQRKFNDEQWKAAELYLGKVDEYEIPVYVEEEKYIDKAKEYLNANDYKACAVYVRTAFEVIMKRYCKTENIRVRYRENPKDLTSLDFWIPITRWQKNRQNVVNQTLKNKIESARKFTLNELSHASVANIYRNELEDAIDAVEELETVLA